MQEANEQAQALLELQKLALGRCKADKMHELALKGLGLIDINSTKKPVAVEMEAAPHKDLCVYLDKLQKLKAEAASSNAVAKSRAPSHMYDGALLEKQREALNKEQP